MVLKDRPALLRFQPANTQNRVLKLVNPGLTHIGDNPSRPWGSRDGWGGIVIEYDEVHQRAAIQLGSDYLLRAVGAANRHLGGDLTRGAVFIGVIQANIRLLAPSPEEDGIETACPKPVSGGALAAMLGIPAETVRRKVKTLIEDGYLVRVNGGLTVPAEVLARPEISRLVRANYLNLRRLFRQLRRVGVDMGRESGALGEALEN